VLARRRAAANRERERLTHALHSTSLAFPPTAAPFVWLSSETHDGTAIAQHLGVRRILVARGERWGDERHVRITLRDADATDRLLAALRELG
jgi:histidinol-phosphate aminotransferase